MREFDLEGHTYRISKPLDCVAQFHIVRRISPLLSLLREASSNTSSDAQGDFLERIATGLAAMPEDDCNYVINATLKIIERKVDGDRGWIRIWEEHSRKIMIPDINLPTMMQLIAQTLMDSFGPFFPGGVPNT